MPAVVAISLLSNGLFDGVAFGKILLSLVLLLAPREIPSLASCPVARGKQLSRGGGVAHWCCSSPVGCWKMLLAGTLCFTGF